MKGRALPGLKSAAALAESLGEATFRRVPLSQISATPGFNPRGQYDPDAFSGERLQGLAASLRAEGMLNPLWLRTTPQGLALIAGERRFRAAGLAGLTVVPALVFGEVDDAQALRLAIIENGQREDLSIVDETFAGFTLLRQVTRLAQEDLVAHLNRVRKGREEDRFGLEALLRELYGTGVSVWSQQRARILAFTPAELEAVRTRQLDVKVAYELVGVKDPAMREQVLREAVQGGWNAARVRARVQELRTPEQAGGVKQAVRSLRADLPRLARLKGKKAQEGERLIQKLRALLDEASASSG